MYERLEKPKESKSHLIGNAVSPKKNSETTFPFVGNRSGSIAQPKQQMMANNHVAQQFQRILKKGNNTELSYHLKSGFENISGHSMDDVKVHCNSNKPDQLNAHSYAQGRRLPDEDWHVVQQEQGRVKPIMQMMSKVNLNDDEILKREADVIGTKVMYSSPENSVQEKNNPSTPLSGLSIQLTKIDNLFPVKHLIWDTTWSDEDKEIQLKNLSIKDLNVLQRKFKDLDEEEKVKYTVKIESSIKEKKKEDSAPAKKIPQVDTGQIMPTGKTPQAGVNIIHVNYRTEDNGKIIDIQHRYLTFFAEQAASIGLQLEVFTTPKGESHIKECLNRKNGLTFNITTKANDGPISEWAEDNAEFLQNGRLAVLEKFNDKVLNEGMEKGRKERWGKEFEEQYSVLKDLIPKGIRVNAGDTSEYREKAARDSEKPVAHIRAYLEGGNMITAEDSEGNPIILVGKDSVSATKHAYQLQNEKDVIDIIAEDFGLTSDKIIAVEQPGKFHLDMGLLVLGSGRAIVNDSTGKLKQAEEATALYKKLELICKLEGQAEADLAAAGFEVKRAEYENDEQFNFFNGEFVTGKDGKKYYITNGGPTEKQDLFKKFMLEEKIVDDVNFSPENLSKESLREGGGLGCRIKGAATNQLNNVPVTRGAECSNRSSGNESLGPLTVPRLQGAGYSNRSSGNENLGPLAVPRLQGAGYSNRSSGNENLGPLTVPRLQGTGYLNRSSGNENSGPLTVPRLQGAGRLKL